MTGLRRHRSGKAANKTNTNCISHRATDSDGGGLDSWSFVSRATYLLVVNQLLSLLIAYIFHVLSIENDTTVKFNELQWLLRCSGKLFSMIFNLFVE
jgi:hypothetical protein